MKNIEMTIECPECKGTGVYVGMGERDGAAVVCQKCSGTGAYQYKYRYNGFTGKKHREDVKRVYKSGYGYVIGVGEIKFGDTNVDMGKEGIRYEDFLRGDTPKHIEGIACPMIADQGACHKIEGFTDKCSDLNGCWVGMLSECRNQCNKADCWKRFNREI